ncbi:hypothetical protein HPB50_017784 [Hyalomma asiaticum]|uniref:Uncharacterized protein n=1 Tax=Hyalomma asiaticum TaxID=266040 RepID=A0ACB7TMD1_HYAAI|nr:hypothetical protein HPB50_017784 [Hyalomma asiaticum]
MIIKNKASILGALESGASAKNKIVTAAEFPDVDKAVFTWFCEQRASKVPLSSRILQQNALDFASMPGHNNFKASPGWLSCFKACHDIVAKVVSGEVAAVDSVTTSSCLLSNKGLLSHALVQAVEFVVLLPASRHSSLAVSFDCSILSYGIRIAVLDKGVSAAKFV